MRTVFVSYFQATGGSAVLALRESLHAAAASAGIALKLWVDLDETPTAEGMREGIRSSDAFLLILSTGVLTRPAVQHEVAIALREGKRLRVLAAGGATAASALAEARAFPAARAPAQAGDALLRLTEEDRQQLEGARPAPVA